MKRLLFFFLLVSVRAFAQPDAVMPGCTEDYFRFVVGTLSHDSMEGRLPGTPQEKTAGKFIAGEFGRAGCKPIKKKNCFPFSYVGPDSQTVIQSYGNVMARIDTKSKYTIVITAHYDHIGRGKYHSMSPFDHSVYNGADDNASGVAMMLGLAGWCNAHKRELNYDLIFIAFSGEEDGLFGSVEFLKSGLVDTAKILCNLNFDMVGRLDLSRPQLLLDGALDCASWDSVLPADTNNYFFSFRRVSTVKDGADHYTFLHHHIPAILFTTGLTNEYHTPNDDIRLVNFPGMVHLSEYLQELILNMNRRKDLAALFARKMVRK
jgi:hypothetical protein